MEFAILRDCWDTSLAFRGTASKKKLSWHQGTARLPAIIQAVLSVSLVAPLFLGAGQIMFLKATEAWPAATGYGRQYVTESLLCDTSRKDRTGKTTPGVPRKDPRAPPQAVCPV